MARRKIVRKTKTAKARPAAPKTAVQQALELTWVLKGHLKNAQISYLRVGAMLRRVRDEKLYAALGHADIESYAGERLRLGRASLYRYLKVYDWVSVNHKEWLEPKPKGFIPDLADVADLITIEKKLSERAVDGSTRSKLEDLRAKALDGRLKQQDLRGLQRRGVRGDAALKAFLSKLRLLRKRGAAISNMPAEVIAHLDGAIGILKNTQPVQLAGLALLETGRTAGFPPRNLVA